MAQQLHAKGHEVAFLGLFETYNWERMRRTPIDIVGYNLQKIVFHWRNFALLNARQKLTFFNEKFQVARARRTVVQGMFLTRLGRVFRRDRSTNGLDTTLARIWEVNDAAAFAYRPRPYPGRIMQFRPAKEYAVHRDPAVAWDGLALDGVESHRLPVYPAGMMVEPFIEQLARELRTCIEKALETHSVRNRQIMPLQRADSLRTLVTPARPGLLDFQPALASSDRM
jgi:thioesterase domain-containing protein